MRPEIESSEMVPLRVAVGESDRTFKRNHMKSGNKKEGTKAKGTRAAIEGYELRGTNGQGDEETKEERQIRDTGIRGRNAYYLHDI